MSGIMKFVLGLVVFVVVVPVIAAGIFVATFDAEAFKKQVTQQVSEAIGREVVVAGKVDFSFTNGLSIGLNQVSIGNPAGFPDKDFAKAGKLFVALDIQALLMRKIDVSQVKLADASVNLMTNTAGQNNWDFKFGKTQDVKDAPGHKPEANMVDELKQAAKEGRKPDFSINSVALNNVELTNASVSQVDMRGGKRQEFMVKHALLKVPASGSFHGEGEGLINGVAFDIKLDTKKSLREVKEGTPIPFELKLSYGGQNYDVKSNLSWKGKTYRLADLQAKVMGIDLSGNVVADMGGAIPNITGDIATPELNLSKLSPPKSAANGQVLATPIAASKPNLSALQSFNSDLGFTTPRLIASPSMTLNDVNTRIKVANGILTLNPLKMTYNGVPWAGLASVDAASNIRAAFRLQNVNFDELAKSFGSKSPVHSNGDITFDLTGRGMDAQAFMSTMSGKLEMVSGPGKVDFNAGNGMGAAMVKALVPNAATQSPQLTCAVARFNANDGVLTSNGLLLDSNYATVAGQGTVNLGNQSVNMVLRPVPKGATTVSSLTTATPIRVTGTLNNLSYVPEADAILQKAVGGLFSPGQKINTGVPRVEGMGGSNPCVTAINNPQPIMIDPPKTEQIFKDVRDTVKDNFKNVKDIVKDPGKGLGGILQGLGGKQPAPANANAPAPQPQVQPANAPPAPAPAPKNEQEKAMDALKGMFGK